jgi:hypothetical protein
MVCCAASSEGTATSAAAIHGSATLSIPNLRQAVAVIPL